MGSSFWFQKFTNAKVDCNISASESTAAAYYRATSAQAVFSYVLNSSTAAGGGVVANQIDSQDTFTRS